MGIGTVASYEDRLASARAEAIFHLAPNAIAGTIAAMVICATYWSKYTSTLLSIWLVAVLLQFASGLIIQSCRRRGLFAHWTDNDWLRMMAANMFGGGLLWGLAGYWALQSGTPDQIMVASVMALGAVVSTFPFIIYMPSYLAFQVPTLTLSSLGFALSPSSYGWMMAIACLSLSAALAIIGREMSKGLIKSICLSIQNERMADKMSAQAEALRLANEELSLLSLTDPLTGLGNRRALMQALRAERGNRRCAFVAIDLDHFKTYNDSFGHVAGDACLQVIAGVLARMALAHGGCAARQGGEEFALVIPDVSLAEAHAAVEMLRAEIEWAHVNEPGLRRKLTASIGFAFDLSGRPLEAVMTEADDALYRAKHSGRNRVAGPAHTIPDTALTA